MREKYRFVDGTLRGNSIIGNYRLFRISYNTRYQSAIKAVFAVIIPVYTDPELSCSFSVWHLMARWKNDG